MKTTLWKQIGLLSLPFFALHSAYAGEQHEQQLLHHANFALHDSLIVKTSTVTPGFESIIQLQSSVKTFVDVYLKEHDELLEKIEQRNASSFKLIRKILVKHGVPEEMIYLAIVESKLKNTATSGAGAAGVWQLMPVTAQILGLKVNAQNDQRRNIYHSTAAAAEYLNDLYKQFDDWLLVVAAYNCGAGNVYKAIKLSGSRDFWKLQRYLPKESRDHVKRFIATHFYYEEKGSPVTLTKAERTAYFATLKDIATPVEKNEEQNSTPASTKQPVNWVFIAQHDGELLFVLRK